MVSNYIIILLVVFSFSKKDGNSSQGQGSKSDFTNI